MRVLQSRSEFRSLALLHPLPFFSQCAPGPPRGHAEESFTQNKPPADVAIASPPIWIGARQGESRGDAEVGIVWIAVISAPRRGQSRASQAYWF